MSSNDPEEAEYRRRQEEASKYDQFDTKYGKFGRGSNDRRKEDWKYDKYDDHGDNGKYGKRKASKTVRGAAAFGGGASEFGDDLRDGVSDFGSSVVSGGRNPGYGRGKYRDAISELYDEDEKEAVYRSSMKKGGAVREFNETMKATFKPPAMPEMKATMGATGGLGGLGFGGGKENQKPSVGVGGWRPHPEPQLAGAFRREIPTKLPPPGERSASPEKQGFQPMGSGLLEDKVTAARRFGLRPKPV